MPKKVGRPALALTATALTAVLLTACGGGDSPEVSAPTDTGAGQSTGAPSTPAETPSTPADTPSTTSSPTTKAAPPAGKNVMVGLNKKFQITKPAGWKDMSEVLGSKKQDVIQLVIADQSTSTNLNVASMKLALTDTKAAAEAGAKKNKTGDKTVAMKPERTIAGEKANGYTLTDKAKTQSQTQYYLAHDGYVYVVTLTNPPNKAADANKALDGVASSWTWK